MLRVPQIHSNFSPYSQISLRDLRPVVTCGRPAFHVRVLKAIVHFVKNIFKEFSLKKEPTPFDLSRRQIRLIRQAQVNRTFSREHSVKVIKPSIEIPKEEPEPQQEDPIHDQSLEKMKAFLQSFSQIVVNECTYEDVLTPKFPDWKEVLLNLVAAIPEWNETFLKLKESASPLLSGLKSLDDAAVTLVIQQMLKHYVKIDQETVKEELLAKLQELWESDAIDDTKYHQAKKYLDPMLNWLYHPNNWMVRSPQPVNLHHFISDSVRFFDTLTRHIQDGGMNDYLESVRRFIDEDFESEIKETLELNTKHITRLLSARLADLIEHLPFTETYNKLLRHIVSHMDGWIAANQSKLEQEKLVEDAEKADKARPTNVSDIERQKTAQELLELIKQDGGRENYLANEFLRAFSQQTSCHPKVSSILSTDDEEEKNKIESTIFRELIDHIFPIILPKKKYVLPYGLEVEVNGISKLIRKISYPEKMENLRQQGFAEFEKVLEASDVNDKENFRDYFFALSHIIMVEYIQSKIKDLLAQEIQNFFNRLASKEYLNYLAAEYLLPSLIDTIFEGFVRALIDRQSKTIAPFFHEMLESDTDVIEKDHALVQRLYESAQSDLIDFQMEEAGIDRGHFAEIVQPVITEIYEFIASKKDEHPSEKMSLSEVRSCLREYFKYPSVQVNHDYGRLIMNALFKIGSFGGWLSEKIIGWLQGTLSTAASQTLDPVSKDHQLLIESVINSASLNMLSTEAVRENLFSDHLSEEALQQQRETVEVNLPLQLRRISALTHDSIFRSLEARSEPWIQHFTPNTDKIDSVIHNVFDNLLGNKMLNTSLLVASLDTIKSGLAQSVIEVDAHHTLQDRLALIESE